MKIHVCPASFTLWFWRTFEKAIVWFQLIAKLSYSDIARRNHYFGCLKNGRYHGDRPFKIKIQLSYAFLLLVNFCLQICRSGYN